MPNSILFRLWVANYQTLKITTLDQWCPLGCREKVSWVLENLLLLYKLLLHRVVQIVLVRMLAIFLGLQDALNQKGWKMCPYTVT